MRAMQFEGDAMKDGRFPAGKGKPWLKRHFSLVIYALLMFGCGVWQLLDWYYGTEDPIWHLLFYLLFMPALSLAYGFLASGGWLAPFTAGGLTAFVYFFMANGGVSAVSAGELQSALEVSVPSFLAALAGVMIRKVLQVLGG